MNENILKALVQLFAIIANVSKDGLSEKSKLLVKNYLNNLLNKETTKYYLNLFEEFIKIHHKEAFCDDNTTKRRSSVFNSVKIISICEEINKELDLYQKFIVLINLFEFIKYGNNITEKELDFIFTVADIFRINPEDYTNCKNFILQSYKDVKEKQNVLIIQQKEQNNENNEYKYIYKSNFQGEIVFLFIKSINSIIFQYYGTENIILNSQNIVPYKTYVFDKGAVIKNPTIGTLYYTDIFKYFIQLPKNEEIIISAHNVTYKFKNSNNGIIDFNFYEKSGQFVGIMGGSGVGKSTLLNILNGNIIPQEGKVLINGYDVHKEKDKLSGIIGFVPQDDLLIEELTVFQNLYYNAKLCFAEYNNEQLNDVVVKVLADLDLIEIKDLIVGTPLNKSISGGQRKRLNIGLELIRQPHILFVDEPTSGLSSTDSEMVINLLKDLSIKGKLVIINIHQPSSDIYKTFDKIIFLDKGGYPIYYGNPVEALVYFKKIANYVNADEGECEKCGNINPEQILQIIEAKVINEYGKQTNQRKISPQEWHNIFKQKAPLINIDNGKKEVPKTNFKIPSKLNQMLIFLQRDILSKIKNKQYLIISILETPILAFILSFFTKYIAGSQQNSNLYIFSENENLVAYLFMSVVVALFIGMSISAEEILKDRKILQRESFLNLSRFSYINSKLMIMLLISAIQTILYIIVGNYILEIKGMTAIYWIILFSVAFFANIFGLLVSSTFNDVVTIYIVIPFLLVPQLLFSGTIVKFDKLHKTISSEKYVPMIGEVMASRWAFEALAVSQFKYNEFEKHFFNSEQQISLASFKSNFLIPEIISRINDNTYSNYELIKNEIKKLQNDSKIKYPGNINDITKNDHNTIVSYLNQLTNYYDQQFEQATVLKDKIHTKLVKELGNNENFQKFKQQYYNNDLADIVLNKKEVKKIIEYKNELIQKKDPVFLITNSYIGRSHFYASTKTIAGYKIETIWYNVIILWLMSSITYLLLYFDIPRKIVNKL